MPFASVLKQFKKTKRRAKSSNNTSLMDTAGNTSELTTSLDIIGRNSMALPIMMRDINVMKQGILKLVKATTGRAQADKTDKFFASSSAREKDYESQMAAKTSKSPTKTGDKKDGKGFFGQANDFLNAIIAGGLTNMLIKGGLIAGILYGIGKFFTSAEFRNGIFDMIGKFGRTVFGEEGWKDVKKNILYGSAILLAGMVAIKGTISLVVAGLAFLAKKLFGFGGVSSMGGGVGGRGRGGAGKVFRGLGMAGIGLGLYNLFSGSGDGESSGLGGAAAAATGLAASSAIDMFAGPRTTTPAATPTTTEDTKGPRPKGKFSGRAWDMNPGISKTAPTKALESVPKGKFLVFLERVAPDLFKKIGKRLLAAGAGLFVPGPGWFMTALSIVGTLSLAWELYGWWKEFNGEGKKESTSPTKEETEAEKQSKSMSLLEMIRGADADLLINNTPNYHAMPGASAPTSTSPSPSMTAPSTSPSPSMGPGAGIVTGKPGENRGNHAHAGWDLARELGAPIYATKGGTVKYSGEDGPGYTGYGRAIEIDHGDGTSALYAHLDKRLVQSGQIQAGQQIGTMGNSGKVKGRNGGKGVHLHYEERKNGVPIDNVPLATAQTALTGSPVAAVKEAPASGINSFRAELQSTLGINGFKLNSFSSELLNSQRKSSQASPVNIDARTSNSTIAGGGGNQISSSASGIIDTEMAKLLVERAIG